MMIDYTIKNKLRFNNPLTYTESHILYDCVDKLEQIEQIINEWNNDVPWVTSKDIMQSTLLRIQKVLEQE